MLTEFYIDLNHIDPDVHERMCDILKNQTWADEKEFLVFSDNLNESSFFTILHFFNGTFSLTHDAWEGLLNVTKVKSLWFIEKFNNDTIKCVINDKGLNPHEKSEDLINKFLKIGMSEKQAVLSAKVVVTQILAEDNPSSHDWWLYVLNILNKKVV